MRDKICFPMIRKNPLENLKLVRHIFFIDIILVVQLNIRVPNPFQLKRYGAKTYKA
jgi:hypothetical protein